ncbi:MAG: hypothetical protein GY710_03965 [Desulfobacteraceae bacterium]|nr:hypothetical protein [Desulfobacteraceae bacterium]
MGFMTLFEKLERGTYCPNPKIFPIAYDIYCKIMDEARRMVDKRIKYSADTSNSKPYQIVISLNRNRYPKITDMEFKYHGRNAPPSIDRKVALTLIKQCSSALKKHRSTGFFSTRGTAKSFTNVIKFARKRGLTKTELDGLDSKFKLCSLDIPRHLIRAIRMVDKFPNYQEFIAYSQLFRNHLMMEVKNLNSLNDEITFNVLGCQGVAAKTWAKTIMGKYGDINAQKNIGANMSGNDASFNILLGDNVYEFGVIRKNDSRFLNCFHSIYKNKPSFLIPGNHDYHITGHYGKRKKASLGTNWHLDEAWNQVHYQCQHTFDRMNAKYGGNWNMPHRYYCIKTDQAMFYMIDSNTFLLDSYQQEWLKKTYKTHNDPDKWNILCTHHPLKSYGERGGLFDEEYFEDGRPSGHPEIHKYIKGFKLHKNENKNSKELDRVRNKTTLELGHLIEKYLSENNLIFPLVFAAHDHFFTSGPINNNTHQIVIGCGGANQGTDIEHSARKIDIVPEDQVSPQATGEKAVFGIKAYGYTRIKANPEDITIEFYSVKFRTSRIISLLKAQDTSETLIYSCRIFKDARKCEHSFSTMLYPDSISFAHMSRGLVELKPSKYTPEQAEQYIQKHGFKDVYKKALE